MTSKSLKRFLMEHIKQGFLINRLMKIYSLFIVALFSLSAVGLSTYSIRNTYQMVDNQCKCG